MHKERLLRLADKLEGKGPYQEVGPIKEEKFYMGYWHSNTYVKEIPTEVKCGTSACAVGHAMFDPWFQEQGLVPRWAEIEGRRQNHVEPHYKMLTATDLLQCRREGGWVSVREFFGVGCGDDSILFSGTSRSPSEVANNIRNFVAMAE